MIYKYNFYFILFCLVTIYSGKTLERGKLLYSTSAIAVWGDISLPIQKVSQVTQVNTITQHNLSGQINCSKEQHRLKLS